MTSHNIVETIGNYEICDDGVAGRIYTVRRAADKLYIANCIGLDRARIVAEALNRGGITVEMQLHKIVPTDGELLAEALRHYEP